MSIVKLSEENLYLPLELWNLEMGKIYPITKKSYIQNVVDYELKEVYGYFLENKFVAFIIIKTVDDYLPYKNDAFISLFYVSKKYRRRGIATKLFAMCEEKYCNRNILIGKDIYNFFPGLPCDFDNLTDLFLYKRGYVGQRYTHDLISYNPIPLKIINKDFVFTTLKENEKDELINLMEANSWERWSYEAKLFFNKKCNLENYLVVKKENKIIGFVKTCDKQSRETAYNVMWQDRFSNLGGIGPLGIDRKYRGCGLGQDIVSFAISYLKNKGIQEIMIDWTGILEFYQKFNFEVWKSYKYLNYKK